MAWLPIEQFPMRGVRLTRLPLVLFFGAYKIGEPITDELDGYILDENDEQIYT